MSRYPPSVLLFVLGLAPIGLQLSVPSDVAAIPIQAVAPDDVCDAKSNPAKLNFTFRDVAGKLFSLETLKGKVVLIDFWATYCVPCKQEIPAFVDFQTRYGDRGFQVIGLSVDDPVSKLRPFIADFKVNYPVLLVNSSHRVLDAYTVQGLPVNILIGRDGKICRRHSGPTAADVFEREIKSLL